MRQGSVGRSYPHFETTILNPDQKYLFLLYSICWWCNKIDIWKPAKIYLFHLPFIVEWERSAQEEGMCSLDIYGTRRKPKRSSTLRCFNDNNFLIIFRILYNWIWHLIPGLGSLWRPWSPRWRWFLLCLWKDEGNPNHRWHFFFLYAMFCERWRRECGSSSNWGRHQSRDGRGRQPGHAGELRHTFLGFNFFDAQVGDQRKHLAVLLTFRTELDAKGQPTDNLHPEVKITLIIIAVWPVGFDDCFGEPFCPGACMVEVSR